MVVEVKEFDRSVFSRKVDETNNELAKLKNKWEIEKAVSGTFEIPSNILELEGVEYLLKLNIFNEVPVVLSFVAPYIFDYMFTANISNYSDETKAVYVEKATELIERVLGLYKELGIDLEAATLDVCVASKMYIQALASCINKPMKDCNNWKGC